MVRSAARFVACSTPGTLPRSAGWRRRWRGSESASSSPWKRPLDGVGCSRVPSPADGVIGCRVFVRSAGDGGEQTTKHGRPRPGRTCNCLQLPPAPRWHHPLTERTRCRRKSRPFRLRKWTDESVGCKKSDPVMKTHKEMEIQVIVIQWLFFTYEQSGH